MNFRSVVILALTIFNPAVLLASELDSEIDKLQVELRPAKSYARPVQKKAVAKRKQAARPVIVARAETPIAAPAQPRGQGPAHSMLDTPSNTLIDRPTVEKTPEPPAPTVVASLEPESPSEEVSTEIQVPRQHHKAGILYRFSAVPLASFSTLDGGDSNIVSPKGIANSTIVGFAGALTTDVNFGLGNFVLESGAQVLQTGAYTGIQFPSYLGSANSTFNDSVVLTYVGIPINAKWMISGEYSSSFYVKAGTIPVFMVSHQYYNPNSSYYFLQENRFGGYNSFDLLFDAGVGYLYKISNQFGVLGEVGGYQGIIPVIGRYNVFNAGLTAGIGVSYLL